MAYQSNPRYAYGMSGLVAWVEQHPVLVTMVIWPMVTSIVSAVWNKPETISPRLAGLVKMMSGIGFDLPKIAEGFMTAWNNEHPVPKSDSDQK